MIFIRAISATLFAAALTACAPASTADGGESSTAAGSVIRASCRQGECRWLRVTQLDTAQTVPEGELRRLVARAGRSVHLDGEIPERAADADIEWEASDHTEYAFCSKQRPAFAFSGDGTSGLTVHFLDLFDLAGYQMASAALYLRLCEGLEELPEDEKALRSLGYRPGTRNEQIEEASLETMTRF